ncbi:uncharacterized protein LOC131657716 [Vicia villosa]|uniref:uncharacterized protein LOC131657716 n=1 Tax=Vicia villosa TaxID=3911 RepID=UPI00273CCB09|nr:uncharacterized protein LOC131657716 [Vicia villosa]
MVTGKSTPFWNIQWLGHRAFRYIFPNLYQLVEDPNSSVYNIGCWVGNGWEWQIENCFSVLNQEACNELSDLKAVLDRVAPSGQNRDVLIWPLQDSHCYSVRSYYTKLVQDSVVELGDSRVRAALQVIWKVKVPSKMQIFGWRLMHDRLPTKSQLSKRGIIMENADSPCVFGCGQVEEVDYVFISCCCGRVVWSKMFLWLGLDYMEEVNCCDHFIQMVTVLKSFCVNNRADEIWLAVCWCLWRHHDKIIFNNRVADPDEIVHNVMMYSWWWLAIGNMKKVYCNFYEWSKNPLKFL